MSRAKKRRQLRDLLIGLIVALMVLLSVAYVGTWMVRAMTEAGLDATNCPEAGSIELTAIVLDGTDRLNSVTLQDLENRLANFLENDVAFGEGVQIWRVSSGRRPRTAETGVVCRPEIPTQSLTSNVKLAREDHETQYMRPIMSAVKTALSGPEESSSPILETVQDVVLHSATAYQRRLHLGRVVLASDLAQNTTTSLELATIDFDRFRHSEDFAAVDPKGLKGITFVVLHIQRRRHLGRVEAFEKFWRVFVESQGGTFTVESLRGLS